MDKSERAKQFMPFAALKGYEQALREKEKIVVPKKELSEDEKEELDRMMQSVKRGDVITAVYYNEDDEEYIQVTGVMTKIDLTSRMLRIVNTNIPLDAVCELRR